MPMIEAAGCRFHVQVDGPETAPALMLSNSLGTDLRLWDEQASVWARHFRLVRYDGRGHGRSEVTRGPYSMERLGRDAVAIMDALALPRVHWCGLSMGGMIGQWLAAETPERIGKLILSNTSSYFPNKDFWDGRIKAVREQGLAEIADGIMRIWFTETFTSQRPELVARAKAMLLAAPPDGYTASCEAIRDMDHRELLRRIKTSTLVIAGKYDRSTPLEAAEFMRSRIPDAALTLLNAAHISNIEQPAAFTAEVLGFLTQADS